MELILPTKATITIATMLNFDSDFNGYTDGKVSCEQTLNSMKDWWADSILDYFQLNPSSCMV